MWSGELVPSKPFLEGRCQRGRERATAESAQLLPARIVGELTLGRHSGTFGDQPGFYWYVEPSEEETNSSVWTVVGERRESQPAWESMRARIGELRPIVSNSLPLTVHYGDMDIFEVTPAARLALYLLIRDLKALHLVSSGLTIGGRVRRLALPTGPRKL